MRTTSSMWAERGAFRRGSPTTQVLPLARIWTQGASVHIMRALLLTLDSAQRVSDAGARIIEDLVKVGLEQRQQEPIFMPVAGAGDG